jgi:hypothetical protein
MNAVLRLDKTGWQVAGMHGDRCKVSTPDGVLHLRGSVYWYASALYHTCLPAVIASSIEDRDQGQA